MKKKISFLLMIGATIQLFAAQPVKSQTGSSLTNKPKQIVQWIKRHPVKSTVLAAGAVLAGLGIYSAKKMVEIRQRTLKAADNVDAFLNQYPGINPNTILIQSNYVLIPKVNIRTVLTDLYILNGNAKLVGALIGKLYAQNSFAKNELDLYLNMFKQNLSDTRSTWETVSKEYKTSADKLIQALVDGFASAKG